MGGYIDTPPLVRWRIIHYYSVENVTKWSALTKRLDAGLHDLPRNRQTCKHIVQLWLRTGDVRPASSLSRVCRSRWLLDDDQASAAHARRVCQP